MTMSEQVTRRILEDIGSGRYRIGEEMPAEAALAQAYDVSRLTIREAVKDLSARGVIEVRQGRRNRVRPPSGWSALDPDVMTLRGSLGGDAEELTRSLMESRRVIEVGTASLAATRIRSAELRHLRELLEQMREGLDDADATRSAEADLNFHRAIIAAARNEFLAAAYEPLEQVLRAVRLRTSSHLSVRVDAVRWHAEILSALERHDAEGAAAAMAGHMEQSERAAREFPAEAPAAAPAS
ncbi:FCD domain-containing protein [Rothia sp. AR01]|uniref:FCD domain-containing protein n=1 Tax=Rothia santali TaxID=2949643 RepID=A0A9X2HGQ3_9MICC|nr:FCD domain-containing protein [Rothia santali]MCP3425401.1 FCD domain-containing protein [Rothia santali]